MDAGGGRAGSRLLSRLERRIAVMQNVKILGIFGKVSYPSYHMSHKGVAFVSVLALAGLIMFSGDTFASGPRRL